MTEHPLPELLNEQAAARYLGVSPISLKRLRRTRRISCRRIGPGRRRVVYLADDLQAYLRSCRQPALEKSNGK